MKDTSAAEFAALAKDAYSTSPKGSRVYGWRKQQFFGDPDNGFFAATYHSEARKKLVVAFRGTEMTEGNDWRNNFRNTVGSARGSWDSQLNTALSYFRAVRSIYAVEDCAVCGHSLGGFLAAMVAIQESAVGVTFNSAPLGLSGLGSHARSTPRIVNFRLAGDVVSGALLDFVGPVIELRLSKAELWVRSPGLLGDLDPLMHSMSLVEEAILLHANSDKPPADWVAQS
jgi:pimeloyl-ACP methyl ester carboxylesterase